MYWFVFISNNILLQQSGERYSIPSAEAAPTPLQPWDHVQELPPIDGEACRAYSLTSIPHEGLPEGMVTMDLRTSYKVLPLAFYNMAGKASELLYWHSTTRYCGYCGGTMSWTGPISKQCDHCKRECWPQVAPAIIVLIRKAAVLATDGQELEPEKVLMVHAKNFHRSDYYGLVAGFVETGETLEECVYREVSEEVGIEIENVRYFGSQAWPYPSGVMVGFTADYVSGEIKLQESELSRGGWFDKDHMPHLPDKLSIARMLVDSWLSKFDKAAPSTV